MGSTVLEINKGVNKPIEFKGIKAQYIGYLAAGLVSLLLLFVIFYIVGIPAFLNVPIIGSIGYFLVAGVFRLSKKYGPNGLMKLFAWKRVPSNIVCRSRRIFFNVSK